MANAVISITGIPPALAQTAGNLVHAFLRGMADDVAVEVSPEGDSAVATLTDIRPFLVAGFPSRVLFLRPLGRKSFDVQMA